MNITEVNEILNGIQNISEKNLRNRKYWLIRTESGLFYETFLKNGFVALGHNEINNTELDQIFKRSNDEKIIKELLKALVIKKYGEEENVGLITGQIFRFYNDVRENDIVLIPSENSEQITIGRIREDKLLPITTEMLSQTECNYFKRKKVDWIKSLDKKGIDPMFFKVLQSHQAINDISDYSILIEKNIENYFIKDNIEYLVFDVKTTDSIKARDLFDLGGGLLDLAEEFFKEYNLPFSVDDFDVTVNLNSPGKITFKALSKKGLWFVALLTIAINGGGLKIDTSSVKVDLSTDGIIKNITEFLNKKQEREIKNNLESKLDSLKVESPDDAINIYKQFSDNKDKPK